MIYVGENIHIVSKVVKEALLNRDEAFVRGLIAEQRAADYLDLNVGPAKGELSGVLGWICELAKEVAPELKISLDTTNFDEISKGLEFVEDKQNCILNSTSSDEPKLSNMLKLALANDCNLVALTMSKENGIPKSADGRLEIACEIYEKALEMGIDTEKIFFDPLILPVTADQSQAQEAINTIKMIKESFEPSVKTIVGLSNISNGCPIELRPIINRVMGVLCCGAGLDAVIADAKDEELVRIFKMIDSKNPETDYDELYIELAQMVENFGELEDVNYDSSNPEQVKIIKTAKMLYAKNIYSASFLNI